VALINLDMISRSDSSGVFCSGISSAAVFPELVKKAAAEEGIHIIEKKSVSRSDHAPFYQKNIPVLGFDTGEHKDYHQPTDTVDKCNFRGMEEICRLVYRLVWRIAESDKAPIFLESGK